MIFIYIMFLKIEEVENLIITTMAIIYRNVAKSKYSHSQCIYINGICQIQTLYITLAYFPFVCTGCRSTSIYFHYRQPGQLRTNQIVIILKVKTLHGNHYLFNDKVILFHLNELLFKRTVLNFEKLSIFLTILSTNECITCN